MTKKPYLQVGLYGQCTWFAWGGSMNYMVMILALAVMEAVV